MNKISTALSYVPFWGWNPAKSGARLILPGHINRLDTCGSTLLSPDYLPLYLGTAALIQTFVAIPFLVAHDQIEKLDKDVSRELQKSTKILIPSPLSTAGKCVAATSFGVYVLAHVLFYPGKARGIIAFLSRFSLALGLELASVGSSKKDKLIGISCTSSLFVACEIWMRVFKKDLT
ncbi:MAG: hypothetical protein SNF33_03020 [Candidatus Algichlamydia australiensis]|nr:hypothetical protein [Chlamydiales bacterium]